jgi:ribonucleoside-diphosphate reductase alpha chain
MSKIFEEFVAVDKYCRWVDNLGRRETWEEAVDRYFNYLNDRLNLESKFNDNQMFEFDKARTMMKKREIFGSMRALMTAGPALDKDDVAAYNCCYVAVNSIRSFSNILYTLACGTGVGFSVESQEINNLPVVPKVIDKMSESIIVEDSREGWAEAYKSFIEELFNGKHFTVDVSKIRSAGTRLKTFGGRASGPEPFVRLIKFTANIFHNARGRKLKPIEVHDLVCQIADSIISGGVRRSALISLSDLSDYEMAHAKSGPWWESSGHRSLANNSAVFESKPDLGTFMHEWSSLFNSRSGERGICNREVMKQIAARSGRNPDYKFGTNPCSEIILRPNQFCNLSTIVVKPEDQGPQLIEKIRLASLLGTLQSALTNFTYFKSIGEDSFKSNCEEERLLGVSMTGIFDNNLTNGGNGLEELQKLLEALNFVARKANEQFAEALGINPSLAVTCVKPEGTTSCVAGSASGLHPRYDKFYIRRIRMDKNSPMARFMARSGIPSEPCVMKPDHTVVFSFPIKADFGVTQNEISALGHLQLWLAYQLFYCDHKPSVTVNYTENDFLYIGGWLWQHWHLVSGVSFLPKEEHIYQQAPFESISEEQYNALEAAMPTNVDWNLLSKFEKEDTTKASHELACVSGACELT